MAHYWTDFKQHEPASGLPAGWTDTWVSAGTWSIATGKILQYVASTTANRVFAAWDAVSSVADVEILALVKVDYGSPSTTVNYAYLVARGGGSGGSEDGYFLRFRFSTTQRDIVLGRYVGGTSTQIATYPVAGDLWDDNTWYRVRFRVNGTAIQVKVWADGTAEPGSWQIDTTDSGISAAGAVGVGNLNQSVTDQWAWFSVATGGDTALSPEDVMGDFFFNF